MTTPDHIPWAKPDYWGQEEAYVLDALRSTWISGGTYVDRLEREFAAFVGHGRAFAVSNGTTALHLAYLAMGLRPGDEVIVPGFGFMAAANVALHMGAKPVFAEVDLATWCLDPDHVQRQITERTRAIVAVDTYGNICAMPELREIAQQHDVVLIEDAAEALGSRYDGRAAGTLGDLNVFSFQATKTITTGEGGMVVTENEDYYEPLQLYRSHGMSRLRYFHEVAGHNFRLTNLQAALGCAQLAEIDRIIEQRRRVHALYRARLDGIEGVQPQLFRQRVDPVLWSMAVWLDPAVFKQGRDAAMQRFAACGIETRPGFYAASMIPLYGEQCLPNCESVSQNVISLPTYPTLTAEQIDRICSCLAALRS